MNRCFIIILFILISANKVVAGQSIITEAEGYACMGDDKSRKETEQLAVKDAMRKATEYAAVYIQSETHVKDMALEKDLISAYSNAQVKVLQALEKVWYKDAASGDCYRVQLKVEVVPDTEALAKLAKKDVIEDPAAPLAVKVWTDKNSYREGEKIKLYLKGSKPFYARLIYKDADGNLVQLLPNPYRDNNYFNGGVIYELPAGDDRYDLEVSPPFGSEGITVYAGTAPIGELDVAPAGNVYEIKTAPKDVAVQTRGVKISAKGTGNRPGVAEFIEAEVLLNTGK